jgi:hypothetical protein
MKCVLPTGCYNPNRCGDNSECYWQDVHNIYQARRNILEIADEDILAFGCRREAKGEPRCDEWCYFPYCPVAKVENKP